MQVLSRQGLEIELPDGWDARIYQREAEVEAITRRALHAANFALPTGLGDYAVDAVEQMTTGDVLVVLLEFDPDRAGQGLFRNEGLPAGLGAGDFSPTAMPRAVAGRTAAQWFFSLNGRAFCLYVVLGTHAGRADLLPLVNQVVQTLKIEE
ncbi:MAG TPA: hypothetical protein VJ653_07720 [Acidimicrobiales bacterium]|nr:hypothetical protein [Acidimicrobiales bacterium]